MPARTGTSSLVATRMTAKYRGFLPQGSRIINYANKATGKKCDLCGHEPEKRAPKPGYEHVSEEMRLMRVKLPEDVSAKDVDIGREDFTVTGSLIELNVCNDTASCRARCREIQNDDGTPKWDFNKPEFARFR